MHQVGFGLGEEMREEVIGDVDGGFEVDVDFLVDFLEVHWAVGEDEAALDS